MLRVSRILSPKPTSVAQALKKKKEQYPNVLKSKPQQETQREIPQDHVGC
jgi:hypothetical protein